MVDDHTVATWRAARGRRFCCVHGFGTNKDNWNRFAKYLTPSFHVVAVDLPGFGESTKREDATYAICRSGRQAGHIAEALSLEYLPLGGNSMGGNISGRYAIRFPDKVLTLGLFNTAGVVLTVRRRVKWTGSWKGGENPLLVETPEDFDAMIKFAFVKPPWFPGLVKKMMADEWIRNRSFNEKVFSEITRRHLPSSRISRR